MAGEVQRVLLLLGALVTFLLFAHRGVKLVATTLILVVILASSRRLSPLRRLLRCSVKECPQTERPPGRPRHGDTAPDAPVVSATVSATTTALASCTHAYGEWGPALVLVFEAHDPATDKQRLKIHSPVEDEEQLCSEQTSRALTLEVISSDMGYCEDCEEYNNGEVLQARPAANALDCKEILSRLHGAGLEYRLGPSRTGEYIFCVVRLPELTARGNLAFDPLDLQLDQARARKYAASLGMPLAARVARTKRSMSSKFRSRAIYGQLREQADKACEEGLPPEVWNDLYVRFVPMVPSYLFRHFVLVPNDLPKPSKLPPIGTRTTVRTTPSGDRCDSSDGSAGGSGCDDVLAGLDATPACSSRGHVSMSSLIGASTPSTPPVDGSVQNGATTILSPSVRLRLLLDLVTGDLPGALGKRGPGLKLDQLSQPKLCKFLQRTFRNFGMCRSRESVHSHNPFLLYFLMQDPRDVAFARLRDRFGQPASRLFRRSLFSGVVDQKLAGLISHYFGQQIGFYFAYKQHLFGYGCALSILLSPLLVIYTLAWARYVVRTELESSNISLWGRLVEFVDGSCSGIESSDAANRRWPLWSLLVGVTAIVWGQCSIESWKRQEQRLAKEWGSHRAGKRRMPRPHFRGRVSLSRIDGRLTTTYFSRQLYWFGFFASNLCFVLLSLIFLQLVKFTWLYKFEDESNYASLGAVYSVVTLMLYNFFKVVAFLLTEAENHKHEEYWEASLLMKRWTLAVIVQCWAIFYLLFARPWLFPCAYGAEQIRIQLGVEGCAKHDFECCDVSLKRGREVILRFADVRDEAVIQHTRQFVAGWLVSKIFVHNLLKWFMERLCGFLCNRGLYPFLAVDFLQDLLQDWSAQSKRGRRRVRRRRCSALLASCCPCFFSSFSAVSSVDQFVCETSGLPNVMVDACELQLDRLDPWDLLDSVTDISVHFLVTSVTTVIYPFAPVLFVAHLLIDFQIDLFRLFDRRQPKPQPARGLPVAWVYMYQAYVYVAALSNVAVVTWRTSLVADLFGEKGADVAQVGSQWAFFSTSMLALVLLVGGVRLLVSSVPRDVREHLQRQEEVESFFAGAAGHEAVFGGGETTAVAPGSWNAAMAEKPLSRTRTVPTFREPQYSTLPAGDAVGQQDCGPDAVPRRQRRRWWPFHYQHEDLQVRSLWERAKRLR